MFDYLERTAAVMGQEMLEYLAQCRAAVIGLGGVGGSAAEALCRAGVGHLMLVDHDTVSLSNCNRQIIATRPAVGRPKAEAARERLLSINPDCDITVAQEFILPENSSFLWDWKPDCILDAIDTVTAKLYLAKTCYENGIGLVASMGTGNRMNPSMLRLGNISETAGNGCPLARIMRRGMRKHEIPSLTVVYSLEQPVQGICVEDSNGRHAPGSTPFVPPAAGYLLAYGAVQKLMERQKSEL